VERGGVRFKTRRGVIAAHYWEKRQKQNVKGEFAWFCVDTSQWRAHKSETI